jgi:hypothetical protein
MDGSSLSADAGCAVALGPSRGGSRITNAEKIRTLGARKSFGVSMDGKAMIVYARLVEKKEGLEHF